MSDDEVEELERSAAVTCEIVDVCPESRKIEAGKLKQGDLVFDGRGGTHELVDVRRSKRYVYTTRHDGWEDVFHQADTITIIRPQEV